MFTSLRKRSPARNTSGFTYKFPMFQRKYLKIWRRIANTYPKPTIPYNRAALILKFLTKEDMQKKERGYYKLTTLLP